MNGDIVFETAFKGYKKEAVHAFIAKLTLDQEEQIKALKSEIKQLQGENIEIKQKLDALKVDYEEALKRIPVEPEEETPIEEEPVAETVDPALEEKKAIYDNLCFTMGEKMIIADAKASEIIAEAEMKRIEILKQARIDADAVVKSIIQKAEESCKLARLAAKQYEQQQNLITAGLEQSRRHLDEAVANVTKLLSEYSSDESN